LTGFDAEAIKHIGQLIDDSHDASFERGAQRALYLLDEGDAALAEYFRADAWAERSHIANVRQSWAWECGELQKEMLALPRASYPSGLPVPEKGRRCQILTNRANLLNIGGRIYRCHCWLGRCAADRPAILSGTRQSRSRPEALCQDGSR
jgi:hypothetical protein